MKSIRNDKGASPICRRILAAVLVLLSLAAAPPAYASETAATVAGEPITMGELEKSVRSHLIEIDNQRYEVLDAGLQELIGGRLFLAEAKSRGIAVEALRREEIVSKVAEATDAEIQAVFDMNKQKLGETTLDDVRDQIVAYLQGQRTAARTTEFLGELRAKYPTVVMLKPPLVKVATGNNPPRGAADAAVTIVAFSDYECPYCKRGEQSIEAVLTKYGDKVRYYHRDFPLPFHANARPAAQAARCANEQGKYWDYHAMLFRSAELSEEHLKEIADSLGLDRGKFDECLASGKYGKAIDADVAAGAEVGVSGTPAFFVNGRMLSGAQPAEKFFALIDAELARKGVGRR